MDISIKKKLSRQRATKTPPLGTSKKRNPRQTMQFYPFELARENVFQLKN